MFTQTQMMGFPPVFDEHSRILILGSFPSVKSREVAFYYGNPQNRFWRMICGYFGEEIPETVEGKKDFLLRRKIALWDIATACEVEGSADSSIKNVEIADLSEIFRTANLQRILLNGSLAYDLFTSRYADCGIEHVKMSSTSPANPRFKEGIWHEELNYVFGIDKGNSDETR